MRRLRRLDSMGISFYIASRRMDASVSYYSNVANYIRFLTIGVVSRWLSSHSGTGTCKLTRLFTFARIECEQLGSWGIGITTCTVSLTWPNVHNLSFIVLQFNLLSFFRRRQVRSQNHRIGWRGREWNPEGDDVHFWNNRPYYYVFFLFLPNECPGINRPLEWEPRAILIRD